MEIKESEVTYYIAGEFPRTLIGLNELELLRAVYGNPQDWDVQQRILRNINIRDMEAEIVQRNSDYAIMRICPTGHINVNSHWLIGYADDRGLFIHNLPEGNLDYCSEAMWYILQWINRIEDGFVRVQGDLLLRDITDGWEVERLEREEKNDPQLFDLNSYRMGNNHQLNGLIAGIGSNTIEDDAPVATAKISKDRLFEVTHNSHRRVRRESKKKEYKETALQRRGEAHNEEDGD